MIRDEKSKALIETDRAALANYRKEKKKLKEIKFLKKEIVELKQIVQLLSEKIDNHLSNKV